MLKLFCFNFFVFDLVLNVVHHDILDVVPGFIFEAVSIRLTLHMVSATSVYDTRLYSLLEPTAPIGIRWQVLELVRRVRTVPLRLV